MLRGGPGRLHRSAGGLLSAEDEAAIGCEAAALVNRDHIEVCTTDLHPSPPQVSCGHAVVPSFERPTT